MSKRARQRDKEQQKKTRKRQPPTNNHASVSEPVSDHPEQPDTPVCEPDSEQRERPDESVEHVSVKPAHTTAPDEPGDLPDLDEDTSMEDQTETSLQHSDASSERYDQPPSAVNQLARHIATVLGETEKHPQLQIRRIVKLLGDDFAQEMLEKAREVEEQGGLMLPNGSRRRTFGGVYFYLVKDWLYAQDRREELKAIFPQYGSGKPRKDRPSDPNQPPAPPPLPTATWQERGELITEARTDPGKVHSVKVTLIGKLGKTVERQNFTLAIMNHNDPPKNLPKGVPAPEKIEPTSYIVYIGGKQWRKMKDALSNPDDVAIIEGQQIYDKSYDAICVFATNCTTKLTEQAKREAQRSKALETE